MDLFFLFLCFKTYVKNLHFRGSLCVKGLAMPHRFAGWKAGRNGGKLMPRKFGTKHFQCYICNRKTEIDISY